MGGLARIRQGWDKMEQEKARLLRQMTVQEGLRLYMDLQRAFEPHLRQTEHLFRADRMAYLAELQRRLALLNRLEE